MVIFLGGGTEEHYYVKYMQKKFRYFYWFQVSLFPTSGFE